MYFIELQKKGLVRIQPRESSIFDSSSDFTSKLALEVEYFNVDRTEYRPGINSVINFLQSGGDLTNPERRKEIALHSLHVSKDELVFGQNAFLAKVLNNEYCRGLYLLS